MYINRYSNVLSRPGNFDAPMRQVIGRFFADTEAGESPPVSSQWMPRVDVREEESRFLILADIPGVDSSDIEIHMEKGILSIQGERKQETGSESDKLTRVERMHGSFHRRFALPDSADSEAISARGSNGVLEIEIPKKSESTPRRIHIDS